MRIRFEWSPKVERNRELALTMSVLLKPPAVMTAALGIWRLTADLELTGEFAVSSGLFSHWLFWFGCAVLLLLCSWVLNRYGRRPSF